MLPILMGLTETIWSKQLVHSLALEQLDESLGLLGHAVLAAMAKDMVMAAESCCRMNADDGSCPWRFYWKRIYIC